MENNENNYVSIINPETAHAVALAPDLEKVIYFGNVNSWQTAKSAINTAEKIVGGNFQKNIARIAFKIYNNEAWRAPLGKKPKSYTAFMLENFEQYSSKQTVNNFIYCARLLKEDSLEDIFDDIFEKPLRYTVLTNIGAEYPIEKGETLEDYQERVHDIIKAFVTANGTQIVNANTTAGEWLKLFKKQRIMQQTTESETTAESETTTESETTAESEPTTESETTAESKPTTTEKDVERVVGEYARLNGHKKAIELLVRLYDILK